MQKGLVSAAVPLVLLSLAPADGGQSLPVTTRACALFTAADAQQIMGAPVKPGANIRETVCLYEESARKKNARGVGRIALTVTWRQSAAAENKAWAGLKDVRHLRADARTVLLLTGIGDEAYLTGGVENGKVGTASVLVRKGAADFSLDVLLSEHRASLDALKTVAKKIADQL